MAAGKIVLVEDLGMQYTSDSCKYKSRYGLYKCYCGVEFKAITADVKRGHTKSCGCLTSQLTKDRNTTHMLSAHRLYGTWRQMLDRCTNEHNSAYKSYGGRGITVCDSWLDINNFIMDMHPTYMEGLTLDRIDVNKGYNKDNCRWASLYVQAQNVRVLSTANTSGYKGVSFYKARNKYVAAISTNGNRVHIGYFATAKEAGLAYNKYVVDNNLAHSLNTIEGE